MKKCSKCKILKELSFFNKRKLSKDGHDGTCKECRHHYRMNSKEKTSEYNKYYAEVNKDKIIEKGKLWYLNNKDYKKEYGKQWHYNNKKYVKKRSKEYKENNKDSIRIQRREYRIKNSEDLSKYSKCYFSSEKGKASRFIQNSKRRARIGTDKLLHSDILELRAKKTCYWCNCELNKSNIELDHYIPLAKGGRNIRSNIVASCSLCNRMKHSKMPNEFRKIKRNIA